MMKWATQSVYVTHSWDREQGGLAWRLIISSCLANLKCDDGGRPLYVGNVHRK